MLRRRYFETVFLDCVAKLSVMILLSRLMMS